MTINSFADPQATRALFSQQSPGMRELASSLRDEKTRQRARSPAPSHKLARDPGSPGLGPTPGPVFLVPVLATMGFDLHHSILKNSFRAVSVPPYSDGSG